LQFLYAEDLICALLPVFAAKSLCNIGFTYPHCLSCQCDYCHWPTALWSSNPQRPSGTAGYQRDA